MKPLRRSCLAILMLCSLSTARAEESNLLWQADFASLPPGPTSEFAETPSDELTIEEEDSRLFLRKADGPSLFLFTKDTQKIDGASWENYRVRTRFRQEEKIDFSLVVKAVPFNARAEQGYAWYYVSITGNKVGIECHGREFAYGGSGNRDLHLIPEEDRADPRYKHIIACDIPLPVGEWLDVEVLVGDEKIKVNITDADLREFEFETYPGGGSAGAYPRNPLTDIESFSVEAMLGLE